MPPDTPETPRPKLVLIDGHSIIHRSFHAMKQLAEPLRVRATGELVGSAFGFANTFLHMFGELKPTHVAVTLDRPGKTFRHEITDSYKATRVPMQDEERAEFSRQMDRARQLIETFGMPIYELDGYEADDLLGTFSRQAAAEGADVWLVSMDSDIAQLVNDEGTHLWMYRPYQRDSVMYDSAADVKERYGVLPVQIPDIKALKGDTSDNIPGIPGVGDKTAIKLVDQFGSVESMIERMDEITPAKIQGLVREYSEQLRQSKLLATIVCDAPAALDMAAADFYAHYDPQKVQEFFREMEFRTLIPRLPERVASSPPAVQIDLPAETNYATIIDEHDLDDVIERIRAKGELVLDIEATSRDAMAAEFIGFSLGLGGGEAYYVPVGHTPRLGDEPQLPTVDVIERLKPVLESPDVKITGHNLKFDIVLLYNYGVQTQGVEFDTMIAAYLCGEGGGAGRPEEGNLALSWLYARRFGSELPDRGELMNKGGKKSAQIPWEQVELAGAADCACANVDAIWRLRQALEPELEQKEMHRLFHEIEMPLVSVLARMELHGVAIDTQALHQMADRISEETFRLEHEVYASVGHEFNIGSPQQLSHVLFEEIGLPKTRRLKTGAFATDKDSLDALRGVHPVIDLMFEYRELTKLKSTYLDPLPFLVNARTRRIHTEFNQTGAATGRLSSSNPNVQNIPVRGDVGAQIRGAFIARDNNPDAMLLSADYSQIELRIVAHVTDDPALISAFENDEDIHASTASQVFNVAIDQVSTEQRRRAKVFNFGVLYGLSEYGLSVREKIPREEAADFIRTYFEKYPGIQEYAADTISKVRMNGYAETLFGRRRYIPEIHAGNFQVRNAAERAAVNMPVQGTAADIIKIAMNRLDEEFQRRGLRCWMMLQLHDELIFECPGEELETVRSLCLEIMPQSLEMKVPLKIDTKVGKRWGEMQYGEAVDLAAYG